VSERIYNFSLSFWCIRNRSENYPSLTLWNRCISFSDASTNGDSCLSGECGPTCLVACE